VKTTSPLRGFLSGAATLLLAASLASCSDSTSPQPEAPARLDVVSGD
jgi:hypothetical protein